MELTAQCLFGGVVLLAGYTVYGLVWRLFLSPVAKFPGPKIAAATFWYEFYYDVVKGGQYVYRIEQMHKQYGEHSATCTFEMLIRLSRPNRENQPV